MKPNRKLKKPQASCSKFDLEEIIGLTVTNANGLASSSSDSKFAYTAGCVVVLYDVDLGTQSHFVVSNRSPKPLSCVVVSQDGSFIAAGESFALDKRWFTIHTVCLDLLNSPEVYNVKEQMVPLSSDLSQSPACEETKIEFMKHSQLKAPESSARKSYSARFTVRRDFVRGQTLVLDSPIIDLCQSTNRTKETRLTNIADLCVTQQEDSERGSNNPQATVSSNSLLQNLLSPNCIASQSNSSSSSSKSTEVNATNIINEKNNIFNDCKEALRTLDASSKTALEVLRDTASTHENNLEASEAWFYAEVAEMLPSIAKNVQEIARFASSCGVDKVDIPGFELLLGKFTESLSQRVNELVKESCTSSS